jgi:hypothetical protein
MSPTVALSWTALGLALLPLALTILNLRLLRKLPAGTSARSLSVLIPARNEAGNIGPAIESVLANEGADFEVIVLDDDSDDATARIVSDWSRRDDRVRLIRMQAYDPSLWGKPQACAELARAARGDYLVFMDADVRLSRDACTRIAAALDRSGSAMLSGVPRQLTGGFTEKLIVPLIHFVLLGFLPIALMRRHRHPGFGAACGQLIAIRRDAYLAMGGHLRIANSCHDGLALPRMLRRAGYMTDLADFTDLASCRMYRSGREVIAGFAKNAHEGLGSPRGLLPWTVLLLGGQCLWIAVLALDPTSPQAIAAALAAYATRSLLDLRFRHSLLGTLLHPFGVASLVAIQWYAALRRAIGRPVAWKARVAGRPEARSGLPGPASR